MSMRRAVAMLALAVALAQVPFADAGPAKVHRDLEYGRVGNRALLLDLVVPREGAGPYPLVIWIHGGSYRSGSKSGKIEAHALVPRGFAVASVDYRLSHESPFPAQIRDCKAAVRWLRAHAAEYALDPARFGVWGSSAGGHLAALMGTSGGKAAFEEPRGGASSAVQAVCDWFGPSDFLAVPGRGAPARFKMDGARKTIEELFGGPIESRRALAASANPLKYADRATPPFLIMHGERDRTVPKEQSEVLAAGLTRAGASVDLRLLSGVGHAFSGREYAEPVIAFFERTLKPR